MHELKCKSIVFFLFWIEVATDRLCIDVGIFNVCFPIMSLSM